MGATECSCCNQYTTGYTDKDNRCHECIGHYKRGCRTCAEICDNCDAIGKPRCSGDTLCDDCLPTRCDACGEVCKGEGNTTETPMGLTVCDDCLGDWVECQGGCGEEGNMYDIDFENGWCQKCRPCECEFEDCEVVGGTCARQWAIYDAEQKEAAATIHPQQPVAQSGP